MCSTWHEIKLCTVNNTFIVGNNSTTSKNGLADASNEPEILIIPPEVDKQEIKEIGKHAFAYCKQIREVIIEARIIQINERTFLGCEKIEKITIPNTCKYIFHSAIDLYNASKGSVTNPGTTKIYFEANSKISFIYSHGISYKENFLLYTCEEIKPKTDGQSFIAVTNLMIYSPVSFVFNKIRSTTIGFSSHCSTYKKKTCLCARRRTYDIFVIIENILLIK